MAEKWIDHDGNEKEPGVIKVEGSLRLVYLGDDVYELTDDGDPGAPAP